MKFLWGGCESRQAAYLAGLEQPASRERSTLEDHARACAECADALRNARSVDTALRRAFAPLRERRTIIAPGRVRLAVGPRRAAPSGWLRVPRMFSRLTEVTVMVGVTFFAVGSSLDAASQESVPAPATHSAIQQYFRAQPPKGEVDSLRWLRLGRTDDSRTIYVSRLPMGGRFDSDPIEIEQGLGISPR